MDIDTLFNEYLAGNEKSEKILFQYLRVKFLIITNQRVCNKQVAEDIVQETLMTIIKKCKQAQFEAGFSAWAYKILEYKTLNHIRDSKSRDSKLHQLSYYNNNDKPSYFADDIELKRKLSKCLRKIYKANIRYARILSLFYQGFSAEEISEQLEITNNNFYVILSRARSMLEYCLKTGETAK